MHKLNLDTLIAHAGNCSAPLLGDAFKKNAMQITATETSFSRDVKPSGNDFGR